MPEEDSLDITNAEIQKIDHKVRTLHQEISTLLRRRNELTSSFRKLSKEIALEIFITFYEDVIPQADSNRNVRNMMQALRLVCSSWNRLIESTPQLWTFVQLGDPFSATTPPFTRQVDLDLSRSHNARLDLLIRYPYSIGDRSRRWEELVRTMDQSLLPQIGRWRSCTFKFPEISIVRHLAGFEKAAPIIERFIAYSYRNTTPSSFPVVNLFDNDAPRLRHLEVRDLAINWNSPILTNLVILRILAWDGLKTPSPEQYCRLLEMCPRLEELRIHGRKDYLQDQAANFRTNARLDQLKVLELDTIHHSTVHSLLLSIQATACTQVILWSVLWNPLQELSDYHVLKSILQDCRQLVLTWKEIRLVSEGRSFVCRTWNSDHCNSVLATIVAVMNSSTISRLDLDTAERYFDGEALNFKQFCKELTNVEVLLAKYCSSLVKQLDQPVSPSTDFESPYWLLPKLCEIEMTDYDTLLDLLKNRYNRVKPPIGSGSPARLKSVTFEHDLLEESAEEGTNTLRRRDKKWRRTIAAMVGTAVLTWHNGDTENNSEASYYTEDEEELDHHYDAWDDGEI
ncbi:hypothetical protein FRC03_012683 [Tulasnella sp. 419]|nr:hypothetical protein FRC02_012491 [Tulasnella sp. 418]KAG8950967.1 hypothetical protein FRC03_012683 [Tulasnella sp. 419]